MLSNVLTCTTASNSFKNLLFLILDTHVNYARTTCKLRALNAFNVRTCTTASNSFNKFALLENRGILGWSIMLAIDWFMWRFPRDRKFLDSKKNCFVKIWQPLLSLRNGQLAMKYVCNDWYYNFILRIIIKSRTADSISKFISALEFGT